MSCWSDRKNVGVSHSSVARTALLYTKEEQAVRLEVHQSHGVLQLIVFGPGNAHRAFDFPDGTALTEYQVTFERGLLDDGFELRATAERRAGADRRAAPRRDNNDRRR